MSPVNGIFTAKPVNLDESRRLQTLNLVVEKLGTIKCISGQEML